MRAELEDCTLYRGDCLEVMAGLPDGCVDLVLTDPPYGTTACKWDAVIPFAPMWSQLKRLTRPRSAIVLTASQPFTSALIMSNIKMFKYCWVWEKSQAVGHLNAWRRPMSKTEDIAIFYSSPPTYNPQIVEKPLENRRPVSKRTKKSDCYGDHGLNTFKCPPDKSMPSNLIKFSNAQGTVHPTQKPVALMEYLIRTYTNPGDTVLDFTMGSGTTGVACVRTGREFIGVEQEPEYFNIAYNRILKEQLA